MPGASADKGVPSGVGSGALLLTRSVDVNQGEVLHDLLHLLELEQGGEAALTCRGRGGGWRQANKCNAEAAEAAAVAEREYSLS